MSKIGLIIGHSETEQGCINRKHSITEYVFNKELVSLVSTYISRCHSEPIIFHRTVSLTELIQQVNKHDLALVVSFHCNAFNKEISGTEVLYYKYSSGAKALAVKLQKALVQCLELRDRGIKPVTLERGAYLLKSVKPIACLIEPFFLDNDKDYEKARDKKDELAQSIANTLVDFVNQSK